MFYIFCTMFKFGFINIQFNLLFVTFVMCEVIKVPPSNELFFKVRNLLSYQFRDPNIVDSVSGGIGIALSHCQETFQWDRWNCPASAFNRQKLTSTKETAFVKAMTTAGMIYSLAKNCSSGQIKGCGCSGQDTIPTKSIHENYKNTAFGRKSNGENVTKQIWSGCSDDTNLAVDITTKLLNDLDKGLDPRSYVSRHNQKVGIEVIKYSMVKKCKCHGISGSCSLQTCWMEIPHFSEISRKLKHLHREAVRVTYDDVKKSIVMGNSATEQYVQEKEIDGTKNRLIYLDSSPDYCLPNLNEGYSGTKGRTCSRNRLNVTKTEKNSCRNLCKKCGHRVGQIQKKVYTRCNCTFTWCCEVKCDTCEELVNEHYCM